MAFNDIPSSYTKNYLPSKNILIIAGIVAVAIGLYFAIPPSLEYYRTHRAAFSLTGTPPEPLIATSTPSSSLDKDTDGDGIPDWQEALFGFDPKKKDTDGDGTPDTLPRTDGKSIGDFLNLSDLNKLTLSVYGKFQDTPTDSIDPEKVAAATSDEVLAHAQSMEDSFKKYNSIDLNLSESEPSDIVTYGTDVNNLLNTIEDPFLLVKNIQAAILDGKEAASQIAVINPLITKLIAMPVPAKISDVHLSLVNAMSYVVQTLEVKDDGEELTKFTRSLVAQKNVNLIQQSASDIVTLVSVYKKNTN